ncbi:MAG: hypothetical protein ACT4N2_06440 [Hyphomicrobium sp.]
MLWLNSGNRPNQASALIQALTPVWPLAVPMLRLRESFPCCFELIYARRSNMIDIDVRSGNIADPTASTFCVRQTQRIFP